MELQPGSVTTGRLRRIYYSATQRAEIWDRWQRGESMSSIGRVFDRQSSSVFSVISPTGGIRPPGRRRGSRALSLSEREEISRGLSIKRSLRVIDQLGRAPSTISREVRRNGGSANIARRPLIRQHGIAHCAPRHASWLATQLWPKQYRQSFGASGHPSRLRAGSSVRSRKKRRNKVSVRSDGKLFFQSLCHCVSFSHQWSQWR